MKRILSILFAATMIFGMAANASAFMDIGDFALAAMGPTTEVAISFGTAVPDGPVAGTVLIDIFKFSDFVGANSYAEIDVLACVGGVINSKGINDWIAVNDPFFNEAMMSTFQTAYSLAASYHTEEPLFRDSNSADNSFNLLMGEFYAGYVEDDGIAVGRRNMGNILTEDIVWDIWNVRLTPGSMFPPPGTPEEFGWTDTGMDLIIYNSGGTTLGTEIINARISAVPIPGAVWLVGSSLLALVGIRRRKS